MRTDGKHSVAPTLLLLPSALLLLCLAAQAAYSGSPDRYIVAAHYYSWYGGTDKPHWPDGVAHRPWIGYYSSADPSVVKRQIDLAKQYGIDVFAVGWTGIDSPGEKKFKQGFIRASNLDQIRFCLVYDSASRLKGEKSKPRYFDFNDRKVRQMFISDVLYLAKRYFGHPSYFKIKGRPVLKIYLTRRFFGDFPSAIDLIKLRLKELGYNPYLVADSLTYGENDLYIVSQFDAVTSYNIYSASLQEEGINTTGKLAQSARPLFWNFLYQLRNLIAKGRSVPVDFQPGVIPQFDARIARNLDVALLAQSKDEVKEIFRLAKEISDAKTAEPKVIWITSWNEWHEGTSIEPTVSGGVKYPGGNYEFDFLEAVSEVFR